MSKPIKTSVVNLDYFHRYLGDNEELLTEVIQHFVEDAPYCLEEMLNSVCVQDWDNIRFLSHKLKSNIDTFGISSSKHIIRKIEDYTRFYVNLDEVPELIDELDGKIRMAVLELEDYL